jgi:hypothetical protein
VKQGGVTVTDLFNLDMDPEEKYDRSNDFPELVTRLRSSMDAFDRAARP